jgi:hypothetical protein
MVFPDRALLGPAIRSRKYTMMLAARNIIDHNSEEFGFVNYFFRMPRQIRQQRQQVHAAMYEYYYINRDIPDDQIYATVTLSQLIDHLRNETFNDLEERASAVGQYIRFNIPTTFKLVEGPPQDNAGRAPFTHVNGINATEKLEVMEIPIYHQWMEDFISGRITTQNTSRPPFYQVPATSLRISPERDLLASAREYITYRKGVQFVEVDDYIRFVRKSDI